jgi:AcrR family transcriptional regulator
VVRANHLENGGSVSPAKPAVDPRPARRQARLEEILSAAWEVANEKGLAGVSLHEVARRVGLRQPSLYAYVSSKNGLYDAMFGQASRALLNHVTTQDSPDDPRDAMLGVARAMWGFVRDNPVEGQLLFERTIPGFEPSTESYSVAQSFQNWVLEKLVAAGVTDPGDVDICTALVAGLISAQEANEPGGDRWFQHLETVFSMFFAYIESKSATPSADGKLRSNHRVPDSSKRSPSAAVRTTPPEKEHRRDR